MAESQTEFDMEAYKNEQDELTAQGDVMPDTWAGYGRLKIAERGFGGKRRTFARRLLAKLDDKYPGKNAELLAEKAIEETEKRFD